MLAPGRRTLLEIETWIFDLDNTLYPASCRLFDQVHARMTRFIVDRLGLSPAAALSVQQTYFREHGTTLRGLMKVNRIDPRDFLAYVHDVDLACVPPNRVLVEALAALPGRKIIHTNGSHSHAERLLDHLGIAGSFCAIFDIAAAGYEPKPALTGYRELQRRHDVIPASALMIEDMARNLVPAASLGMSTAWVRNPVDWAAAGSEGNHIHYIVDDLGAFLSTAASLHREPVEKSASSDYLHDMSVADTIRAKLTERFAPSRLEVLDESHRHAGHEGARPGGETHFGVTIVSAAFAGLGRVARQRLVYQALAQELASRVHALSLTTLTPQEDRRTG